MLLLQPLVIWLSRPSSLNGNSLESLTWNALGKISSYAISGPHQNETRNYGYDNRGRLTEEPYTLMSSANPALLSAGTQTTSYTFDPLNIRLSQEVTTAVANTVTEKNIFSQVVGEHLLNDRLAQEAWESSYDGAGEVITRTSSSGVTQNLTWDSFGRLVKVADNKTTWTAIYDGLGRRIQTSVGSNAINHYYDPEVEFLELGHATTKETTTSSWWYGPIHHEVLCYNWNLYGPDRSGLYGGAQGIGGLEVDGGSGTVQNYFGDVIGLGSSGVIANYGATFTSYGLAPGSAPDAASQSLTPQWRGRYLDETGFVSMGARYYEPHGGRFLSADPLGHGASLSLYDYCNGDPVNGLDPDGRCGEGGVKGFALGSFAHYDNIAQAIGGFVGTGLSYITPGLGEIALARDVAGSAWHAAQALGDMYNNGINWNNSLEAGLATVGVGLGAWSASLPAKVGVEAVTSTSTALSIFRYTSEGETFFHYGYAEHAASFENGLRSGAFATKIEGLSGAEAQNGLALPAGRPIPNAVYQISPQPGTLIKGNPVAESLFGRPGGLPEYQFPFGTTPGTVSEPTLIK